MTKLPLRIQLGHLDPHVVYRVDVADLKADPDGALARALRAVADEIEYQAAEEG
ncbi:hypothetical protein [Amycolatopsis sp. NPDC003731]